jgi:UDPglucose 6-dehydrogenase
MADKLKMGIIGHGFVGKAVDFGFSVNVEKTIIDPNYNTSIDDLKKNIPEVIFICVPTPMQSDGAIDCSIILDVVNEITKKEINSVIVIKSSITPSTLKLCNEINPTKIVYNPEFLTERNANNDFVNPKVLVIGGSDENAQFVYEIHQKNSLCADCPVFFTDLISASLVKYTLNTFLATKVLFMNEIYKIHNSLKTSSSWHDFTEILKAEGRIGSSHMDVPGPDGRFGFGGACFPKDLSALIKFAENEGENLELLKSVRTINNKIRLGYENLDSREKDQNVNFDL